MNNAMPVVSIGGNKDLSGQIVDLRIRHDLNTTSMCTIRAVDHDRLLAETYLGKIGDKITISLSDVTCFSGLVVEVGTEQHPNALPHLMIRGLDPSFLLSHQAFYRSFENQSYTKAVKQLVTDAKLAGSDLSTALDKFAPPYVLQEGTNLAFLEDICLRTGHPVARPRRQAPRPVQQRRHPHAGGRAGRGEELAEAARAVVQRVVLVHPPRQVGGRPSVGPVDLG